MKTLSLHMQNFRGIADETVKFSGFDIITGINGSGKTRILQGLQLALLGKVPDTNKDKNIELLDLFTTAQGIDRMSVTVGLIDERGTIYEIKREFLITEKAGKETISQVITITPGISSRQTTLAKCEEKIKELIGELSFMYDVSEFIRLTPEERAEFILTVCADPMLDFAVILPTLKLALMETPEKFPPTAPGFYAEVEKHFRGDKRIGVTNAINYLKNELNKRRKDKRDNEATSLTSLQANGADPKKSLRHVADIRADIEKLETERSTLTKQIEESKAHSTAVERLQTEKANLARQIEEEKKKHSPENIDSIKLRIEELNKKIVDVKPLRERLEMLRQVEYDRANDYAAAKMVVDIAIRDIERLKVMVDTVSTGKCPTCQRMIDILTAQLAAQDLILREIELEDFEHKLTHAADAFKQSQKNVAKQKEEIEQLESDNNGYLKLLQDTSGGLARLEGEQSGIATLETRLKELDNTTVAGTTIDLERARIMGETIRTNLLMLNTELSEKIAYDSKVELAKQTAAKAKLAEEETEFIKELYDALLDVRWKIIADSLVPVKDEATYLFSSMAHERGDDSLSGAEFSFRFKDTRGNDVFQFGWIVKTPLDDMFKDFDVLSRAEQIFTLVSVLTPLIYRANPKLRLIMLDNCEVIHDIHRQNFVDMLSKSYTKYLDNVMIATSSLYPFSKDYKPMNLDRIEMENVVA